MLALYRSGRQADALAVYQRTRRALADQLGVDPSQSLRDLEVAILRQDPALEVTAELAGTDRGAAAMPVPAQLPPGPPFAGRRDELASLDALLPAFAQAPEGGPEGAAISVLSGTAGVGKTALAVHWARRVSARFPDGQLFASLRGFDPGGAALEPGDALRGFLEAFGIPEARIPADLAGQAGLYRSVLAGRRVLVVLDNAGDEQQVRPLLPASPGCVAGHAAQALALYQAAGDRAGEATGLNDLGFCYARMGSFQEALSYCERGLAICREVGERNWEAATLDSLGLIHDGLGDRDRAVAC